ncbi:MAG: DnaA/Hda family protein [Phycisphaerales bacterium]|nr:DnaA/Hda family protein [Phycisphaerales bacterium]
MPNANSSPARTREVRGAQGDRLLGAVRERVGDAAFDRYFARDARATSDGACVEIVVPSAFHAELISRRFDADLREAARATHGEDVSVRLRIAEQEPARRDAARGVSDDRAAGERANGDRAKGDRETPASSGPGRAAGAPRERSRTDAPSRTGGIGARRTQTLEDLVEGESNRLALATARRVASGEAPHSFSPLLVEGSCGMGKTHLVSGIAEGYARRHPGARVKMISGEAFVSAFVRAVRENRVDAMRRGFRDLDLLCIDDVHLVAGKQKTQEELLHIINELDLRGTFLVIASDAPPTEIRDLSRQLASRFSRGAHARLEAPESDLLARIARSRGASRGLLLSEDAAQAIADHAGPGASPREIEGLVTRVEAAVRLLPELGASDGAITRRCVDAALGAARSRSTRPIRPEEVVSLVCREMGVEIEDVRGRGRHPRVVLARAVAGSLCRSHTTASFPEIAQSLGRPNHSSVVTACGRLKKQVAGEFEIPASLGLDAAGLSVMVERLGGLARRLGRS